MQWTHRLTSTVTYKTPTGYASSTGMTWSSAATAKARVEKAHRIAKGAGGEELTSTHRIATETNIPEGSRVWLPGATVSDVTESYAVLRTEEAYTLDASYTLYILTLGR